MPRYEGSVRAAIAATITRPATARARPGIPVRTAQTVTAAALRELNQPGR